MTKSLSFKVNSLILVVVIITTVLLGLSDYYFEKKSSYKRLDHELIEASTHLQNSIVLPLWNLNIEEVTSIVLSEMVKKEILSIYITDVSTGKSICSVTRNDEWGFLKNSTTIDNSMIYKELVTSVVYDSEVIGSITVQVTDIYVNSEIKELVKSIFIRLLIILVTFIIVFIFVLQIFVIKPILRLKDNFLSSNEEKIEFELNLNRSDEIGLLNRSFINMKKNNRELFSERDLRIRQLETAKDEIFASENRFRQIAENINEVFWIASPDWKDVYYVSQAFEKIWGISCEDIYANSALWMKSFHPDDLEKMAPVLKNMTEGKFDNSAVPEYRVIRKDGSQRWVSLSAYPAYDENGDLYRIVGVAEDITEKRFLEGRLNQSEKMESIGHLAGGIAHDFNNILGAIIGFSEMSLDEVDKGSVLEKYQDRILTAANRAKELVAQILTFSRQNDEAKEPLYVAPIVNEVLQLLQATLPSTIDIVSNVKKDTQPVFADATKIHEIVMNLSTNASQALSNEQGTIEISCAEVSIEEPFEGRIGEIKPGLYSLVTVKDSGKGMDEETLSHIFEPFYTTKGVGKGTGMGLAVVFGIIQSHCGDITVKSSLEEGTTFSIYLPKTETVKEEENAIVSKIVGGDEKILIVDDEKLLLEMEKELLLQLGYDVTFFTDSTELLDEFKQNPDKYDLVITDQTMPKLSGYELTKEIIKIRANFPIILCTGFSNVINEEKAKEAGVSCFLNKPVTRNKMAKVIREIFDNND